MPQTRPGVAAPSDPSSAGGESTVESPSASPAGPSSGGAGIQPGVGPTDEDYPSPLSAPPDPPRNPTGPVPSLRQEASATFTALHDAPEGIGAKWTVEEATYWENRSKREMDAWRKAHGIGFSRPGAPPAPAEKPQRRQGTITRPQAAVIAGRAITTPANGSLTRRTVEPMFKGQ